METFIITSDALACCDHSAVALDAIEFVKKSPSSMTRPCASFTVRVTRGSLAANAVVCSCCSAYPFPDRLFQEMADADCGWRGAKTWESPAGECKLSCTCDRRRQITIIIELRCDFDTVRWSLRGAVIVNASRLDNIAHRASQFFSAQEVTS
jgi:hypothetical protein